MKLLALAGLAAVAACVDKGPGDQPRRVDPAVVQANLLAAVPDIAHRIDARFRTPGGGEIAYLGNDVVQRTAVPGEPITVVHYWRVITPPGPGWRIFGYARGEGGDFLALDRTDMRTGHPSSTWQAGEVIQDAQTFVLARDWKSRRAVVRVGLVPERAHRIADRMTVEVTGADATDRALAVATYDVDLSKAPPPPGTLVLRKAVGPITIDGKADDPGWRNAASQPAFTVAEGCPAMADATEAKMTWDDQYLYVFVSSEDADVHSDFTEHDAHLWEQDVVEVFIDADGNRRGYVELQVNPRGVTFDTWFAVGRPNRDDTFESGMRPGVVVRGTLDDRDDGDAGWDVELAIPWAAAKGKDPAMKIHTPPQLGDVWHLNVVRGEAPASGAKTAASWNRIRCEDFHGLDRMLGVQFADSSGSVKPAPEAPPPVPGPVTPVPGEIAPLRGPVTPVPGATPPPGAPATAPVVPGTPAAPRPPAAHPSPS